MSPPQAFTIRQWNTLLCQHETLGTLETALTLEVLITMLVVIVMVLNLRAAVLISSLLPLAVLMVFITMRHGGVEANIVALSGIAIAIGTMIDLGIVLSENVLKHLADAPATQNRLTTIYNAAAEVSGASSAKKSRSSPERISANGSSASPPTVTI